MSALGHHGSKLLLKSHGWVFQAKIFNANNKQFSGIAHHNPKCFLSSKPSFTS